MENKTILITGAARIYWIKSCFVELLKTYSSVNIIGIDNMDQILFCKNLKNGVLMKLKKK